MDIAFSVDEVLLEWVLVVLSVRQQMRVEARVLEGAVALALVEVLARNSIQCFCILVDQSVLDLTFVDHPSAWNDEVTILSADGATSAATALEQVLLPNVLLDASIAEAMFTGIDDLALLYDKALTY